MTFRRLLAALILMLISLTTALAQGNLLLPGRSGVGFSSELSATRGATAYGLSAGYSLEGRYDVGVSVGHLNRNPSTASDIVYTMHGTYVSPHLTYYILRGDDSLNEPSIGITAAYEHIGFKDTPASSENAYSGTVSIFEDMLHPSSAFKLQPVVAISLLKGETSQTRATLGFFFGVNNAIGKVAGLSATVGYQAGNVTGGVQISAVF